MYGYETFHEDLMKNLIESVHNGASSHAYIFEGEKGLGVLNSARLCGGIDVQKYRCRTLRKLSELRRIKSGHKPRYNLCSTEDRQKKYRCKRYA